MRRRARVDANQKQIVACLRAAGATVEHLHTVGAGVPDLLVGYMGRNYCLEIKGEGGELTPDQVAWFDRWDGQAAVVRTAEEACLAIGLPVVEQSGNA